MRTRITFPLTFLTTLIHALSFGHNAPSQCDPFTVQWSGGTPPFSLLLSPAFDNPRNISIPDTDAHAGSFTFQLPLNAGQQFLIAMSDATGFASGGVSALLTVGGSTSGHSCDTKIPTPAFSFQLSSILQQCAPYPISGYDRATQPVTITGLIPLGKSIQLHPPTGPSSFIWDPVNVPAGTSLIFFLTDANGQFGGSSHINQVGSSANAACLNDQSPTSTASTDSTISPTSTSASTSASTQSASHSSEPATSPTDLTPPGHHARISPGTIGGAVIGGLVAFLVCGSFLAFWFNKLRERRYAPRRGYPGGDPPPVGLLPPKANRYGPQSPAPWTTFSSTPTPGYVAEPWTAQPSPSPTPNTYSPVVATPGTYSPYPPQPSPGTYATYPTQPAQGTYHPTPPAQGTYHPTQPTQGTHYPTGALTPGANSNEPGTRQPYSPPSSIATGTRAPSVHSSHSSIYGGVVTDASPENTPLSQGEHPPKSKSPPPVSRTRLILHTDAEDVEQHPPQYSTAPSASQPDPPPL